LRNTIGVSLPPSPFGFGWAGKEIDAPPCRRPLHLLGSALNEQGGGASLSEQADKKKGG